MIFSTQKQVRFAHCDPAGIVFYPQFYYLLHEAQEDFLAAIGFPQHLLIASGFGLPIVNMRTDFHAMCRYGEQLTITLALHKIGNSSLGMHYEIHGAPANADGNAPAGSAPPSTLRVQADGVVVHCALDTQAITRIPDALRAALTPYLQH